MAEKYEPHEVTQTFIVLPGETVYSSTFIFGNEDHTLGNCLRHILMQQPETDFCGYSVPHPYEPKMNVRLQTHPHCNKSSSQVLYQGLEQLHQCSGILQNTFQDAIAEYKNKTK